MKKWIIVYSLLMLVCSGCSFNQQEKEETNVEKQTYEQDNKRNQQEYQTQDFDQTQTPDLAGGNENKVRSPHPLSLADLKNKYRSHFFLNGPATKRQIAITFDDAPDDQFTPQILDVLKKHDVKATFFVNGNRAEAHPDIMKRIANEDHAIGNHTYSHPDLRKLSDDAFHQEVQKTETVLEELVGFSPRILRAPYGEVTEEQIKWLVSQGYNIVNWNVDSLDWKGLNAEQISDNVLSNIMPGAIILQHSGGGVGEDLTGTVEALPEIIGKLREDNVQFVTVPEMLDIPAKK